MGIRKICTVFILIYMTVFFVGCDDENDSIELPETCAVQESESEELSDKIYVYVTGEVESEGVYCIDNNARLYQVIEQAGGFTKKAAKNSLNLAETVYDGQKIQVLSKHQYKRENNISDKSIGADDLDDGLLDINEASVEELMKLPGIGNTKAKAIADYRDKNGKFSKVEDIKKVSGIGEATFKNIESMITVH